MKRNYLIILIIGASLCAFALASCKKIKDAVKVNVALQMADISFTIPVIEHEGAVTLGEFDVYVNVDSIIKAKNSKLGAEHIKSVKIKSCTVQILDDTIYPDDNFTVLQSCRAELSSNTKTAWETIAHTDSPVETPHKLELPVNSSLELKDYFKGTWFSYRITGTAVRPTTHTIDCKATLQFDISAGL